MIIKRKLSDFFCFGEINSIEDFSCYNFIEEIVEKLNYSLVFNLTNVTSEEIDIYKSLSTANKESNSKIIIKIIEARRDCMLDNIHSVLGDLVKMFFKVKLNKISKYGKNEKIYLGNERYAKDLEEDIFYEIIGDKFIPIDKQLNSTGFNIVYFTFELKKIAPSIKKNKNDFIFYFESIDNNWKKITKKESKKNILKVINDFIEENFDLEQMEETMCSGEYDWIERINEE